MLQQTRVETVRPYYERFLAAFPTVYHLAAADLDEVLRLWAGLGYYARARNLHAAARAIAERRGGRFPRTLEELRKLPGVGRYTAGAIASIAFGVRAPVLDGNVRRVLTRLFGIRKSIERPATQRRLWALAEALLPRTSPGDFNQALMELGARVCTPKQPRCSACPLRSACVAFARGEQRRLPKRRPKRPVPPVDAAAAAIVRAGRVLLVQRPARGLLGGLWEMPSVPLTNGQTAAGTLASEVARRVGLPVDVGRELGAVRHAFTHRLLRLHVYRCRPHHARARARLNRAARWVSLRDLDSVPLATLDRKALQVVLDAADKTASLRAL